MESAGRTLVCSVLFLDIADYSQKPVAEQLQLKQAFNQALAVALEHVAARDRVILDTGDGAAITFMGDPEDAPSPRWRCATCRPRCRCAWASTSARCGW